MTTKIFSIYDGKAKIFQTPFFRITTGMALRDFEDLVNDPKTIVNKHPSDFVLYEIGSYDDNTGETVSKSPINLVATASEYVQLKPKISEVQLNEVRNDEPLLKHPAS